MRFVVYNDDKNAGGRKMSERLNRCYAGWLGKLAGIRMGAPVEGWEYAKIKETYGELNGYIGDLSHFRADDDSNGPLIFIRAMNDFSIDPTSEEIGKTWLNYTSWQHGMFWWGGYGVSTEHTAYMNLAAGIPAPRSGSIAQNGKTVAEQIGGQIFIDPWGLVCPGRPGRAAELARRAAGVSHDGNGIYGAMFVAAAIAVAYDEKDIKTVIREALKEIPEDCEYARAVRAVAIFHEECPEDWRECFQYVHDNWGYDRYPGNCHIIPNAAVMALAMYYGQGDFSRTIEIATMCGWDTDCNAGNVGCIVGTMVGLEGIDREKWLAPMNDGFAASNAIGCLGFIDAPWYARYLDDITRRLEGEPTDFAEGARVYDFELPGSTHGFESETARVANAGGCLKCESHGPAEVYRWTYHGPEWFTETAYAAEACPELWPGQTVKAKLRGAGARARLFVWDRISGKRYEGEEVLVDGEAEVAFRLPALDSACIAKAGVAWDGGELILDEMRLIGDPDYTVEFAKLPIEKFTHLDRCINQFARFKGICDREDGRLFLSCADEGMVNTGDLFWGDLRFTTDMTPTAEGVCKALVRLQGVRRLAAVELSREGLAIVREEFGKKVLARCEHSFELGQKYEFTVECRGEQVTVFENGRELLTAQVGLNRGAVGYGVEQGARMLIEKFSVQPL